MAGRSGVPEVNKKCSRQSTADINDTPKISEMIHILLKVSKCSH
jgi:hypothetical protein